MLRLARQVMFVAVAMLFCAAVSFAADNAVQDVLADSLINRHLHEKLRKKLGNEDDLRALCSGLKICMDIDYEGCFEEDKKPWPHHKYDKEFCGVFKEVEKRGFLPDPNVTMAAEVYARLGRRYRAIYVNEGTLPLNESVIKYLFDNMPFTAQLINAYLDFDELMARNPIDTSSDFDDDDMTETWNAKPLFRLWSCACAQVAAAWHRNRISGHGPASGK